jgi:hypothetical protein
MVFVGASWQSIVAMLTHVDSMRNFLVAHNAILTEQLDEVKSNIPSWRFIARRRAFRQAAHDANVVLSDDEARLLRRYDQSAQGWAILIVGSLASVVAAFMN